MQRDQPTWCSWVRAYRNEKIIGAAVLFFGLWYFGYSCNIRGKILHEKVSPISTGSEISRVTVTGTWLNKNLTAQTSNGFCGQGFDSKKMAHTNSQLDEFKDENIELATHAQEDELLNRQKRSLGGHVAKAFARTFRNLPSKTVYLPPSFRGSIYAEPDLPPPPPNMIKKVPGFNKGVAATPNNVKEKYASIQRNQTPSTRTDVDKKFQGTALLDNASLKKHPLFVGNNRVPLRSPNIPVQEALKSSSLSPKKSREKFRLCGK